MQNGTDIQIEEWNEVIILYHMEAQLASYPYQK